ncbi:hypothetical protein L9F63_004387, partial [Diploptera punctata]
FSSYFLQKILKIFLMNVTSSQSLSNQHQMATLLMEIPTKICLIININVDLFLDMFQNNSVLSFDIFEFMSQSVICQWLLSRLEISGLSRFRHCICDILNAVHICKGVKKYEKFFMVLWRNKVVFFLIFHNMMFITKCLTLNYSRENCWKHLMMKLLVDFLLYQTKTVIND